MFAKLLEKSPALEEPFIYLLVIASNDHSFCPLSLEFIPCLKEIFRVHFNIIILFMCISLKYSLRFRGDNSSQHTMEIVNLLT